MVWCDCKKNSNKYLYNNSHSTDYLLSYNICLTLLFFVVSIVYHTSTYQVFASTWQLDNVMNTHYSFQLSPANIYYPFFSTGGAHLRSDRVWTLSRKVFSNRGKKKSSFSDIAVWGSSRRIASGGEWGRCSVYSLMVRWGRYITKRRANTGGPPRSWFSLGRIKNEVIVVVVVVVVYYGVPQQKNEADVSIWHGLYYTIKLM